MITSAEMSKTTRIHNQTVHPTGHYTKCQMCLKMTLQKVLWMKVYREPTLHESLQTLIIPLMGKNDNLR